ncbi:YbgA family protein [Pseudomonas sp.]|uniref:YbgA family protein n=1 Tax=Pseudomonas sp. TaxID=306 RepID=UPI003CC641A8
MRSANSARIPVGISQCLMGDPVRFNAGHKHSRLCTDHLGTLFELRPFCPEVAIGLGTPRKPIRLAGDPAAPRAVGTVDHTLDVTDALQQYADDVSVLCEELCGFIFMQKSPSCGMERVKVYEPNGHPAPATGRGIFAARLMQANPLLPVEEEGRLNDPVLRENFVNRVIVYSDWQQLLRDGLSASRLLAFHARHKYLLMAHQSPSYRQIGQMLANPGRGAALHDTANAYFAELMAALRRPASRSGHSNVLQHVAGHFKKVLNPPEKEELQQLINHYRSGIVPLVVPVTLLRHHLLRHPDPYLLQQAYLQPHPPELSLRNAI